jgi:hypothetical protein
MTNPIGQHIALTPIPTFPALASSVLSVSPQQAAPEPAGNEIFNLAKILMQLFDEMAGRRFIMSDLNVAVEALDDIKNNSFPPYASSAFDVALPLDPGSPAKGKSLWDLLIHYGIQKAGDSPPKTAQALDELIGSVKTKNEGLSTLSQETMVRLNKIAGNRDDYVAFATQLLMPELKLIGSILGEK